MDYDITLRVVTCLVGVQVEISSTHNGETISTGFWIREQDRKRLLGYGTGQEAGDALVHAAQLAALL